MSEWRGILLVGGSSRRMGRPKALIRQGNQTQGSRLIELLETVTEQAAWLCGEGDVVPGSISRSLDRQPGSGPLSGLLGFFDAAPDQAALVLACDLFAMNEAALSWLKSQVPPEGKVVTWPRLVDRDIGEPLAALYLPAAYEYLQAAWSQGIRSLTRSVPPDKRHEPVIPDALAAAFQGANTPEDLIRLNMNLETPWET